LTDLPLILYLLSKKEEGKGERKMLPTLKARGRCPVCQGEFQEVKKLGFGCPKCLTRPERYFVYLSWKGKKYFIYSNKQGQILSSYNLTVEVQEQIIAEIKNNKTFDPSKYVKAEQSIFYCCNVLDKFLSFKSPSIAHSYITDYKRMVAKAKAFYGTKDVRDIRKIDIFDYKEHVETGKLKEQKGKLSGKTVKNYLDHFKSFLHYCMNELEIIDKVPPFPEVEYKQSRFQWLSQDMQIKLYDLIKEDMKPVFAFLFLHGCRPSEARALRCKDINLDNQSITISATFSGS
jgi:hypothetical protein